MNYFILLLFCVSYSVSANSLDFFSNDDLKCFKLTWDGQFKNVSCSSDKYKNIPCFEPVIEDSNPPNLLDLWKDPDSEVSCNLIPGLSCIKYTYFYNGAPINISYFCGKMTELGCFTQMIGDNTIESCACKTSYFDTMPCNSSSKSSYSLLPIILSIYFILYFFI